MARKKKRREFSKSEKMAILKEALVKSMPISELCEKHNIQPSQYYNWQKILFDKGGFDDTKSKESVDGKRSQKRIKQLEEEIQKKNNVLAELMQEHIALKKSFSGEG